MYQISIIVPVFNVENYLVRCLDSILNQIFTEFKVLLINDGSTDKSGVICDNYAKKDSRISVIHKENGGAATARNIGIEWALKDSESQWITFIDSDDWIHPFFLEFLYKAACESNTFFSICEYVKTSSGIKNVDSCLSWSIMDTEDVFVNNREGVVVPWGKLFRKSDFQSVRFPTVPICEDEFATYKAFFLHQKVSYIKVPLYYYFTNHNSVMNSKWNLNRLYSLEAFKEQMKFFKKQNYLGAYASSARVLYLGYADAVEKIRTFYPKQKVMRFEYLAMYSSCKFRLFGKFVSKQDKMNMMEKVHPKFTKLINLIKKKKSNLTEIIVKKG